MSRGAEQGHRQHVDVARAGSKGKRNPACKKRKNKYSQVGFSTVGFSLLRTPVEAEGESGRRVTVQAKNIALIGEARSQPRLRPKPGNSHRF